MRRHHHEVGRPTGRRKTCPTRCYTGSPMAEPVRHILSSADLSPAEVAFLLDCAAALKRRPQRLLEGRQLALLFEKPSLRTRVSFQVAMRHLGGETIYLAPQDVGLGEREAIKDVSRVLRRYVDIGAI